MVSEADELKARPKVAMERAMTPSADKDAPVRYVDSHFCRNLSIDGLWTDNELARMNTLNVVTMPPATSTPAGLAVASARTTLPAILLRCVDPLSTISNSLTFAIQTGGDSGAHDDYGMGSGRTRQVHILPNSGDPVTDSLR